MKKNKNAPQKTYYIEEKGGRYYVYYLQVAPVETLFEVARTRDQAEQAIKDHKDGKHSTQEQDRACTCRKMNVSGVGEVLVATGCPVHSPRQ